MRLIDADALKKDLTRFYDNEVTAKQLIDEQPTIEPKTGHWRHYEGLLICSECGAEYYDEIMEYCGDDVPKCCPNCDCKMVESQERGDRE